ncbi:MAG TPA: hypothetical protein VI111_02145 [Thermoleophilaceae bacterium]
MNVPKAALLVLFVALAAATAIVIAPPAFATVLATDSARGNASPFITPISGDSVRSRITGSGGGLRFRVIGGGVVRCTNTLFESYIDQTHTQARVTRVMIGSGRPGNCDVTLGGVSGVVRNGTTSAGQLDSIDGGATTAAPWFLHVRSYDGTLSSTGTLNVTRQFSFTITVRGLVCHIDILPQSIDLSYTNANRTVQISDTTVAYSESTRSVGCPVAGNGDLTAAYVLVPQTSTDPLRVTLGSSP